MSSASLPYITHDVATEPPTTIIIVPCGSKPPELPNKNEAVFAITEDCVEPTKGWLNREDKPLSTVCFMHGFGKCFGRTNSNPATCFQLHIKTNVLAALRKHYTNPPRRFFTRTVKALLSPELRQLLCMRAHKELKIQYLEYRVSGVSLSTGLLQYEAAYRRWLFSADAAADHDSTIMVPQCLSFAVTGTCSGSTDCPFIHADLKKAQVRDPMLARALRDVSITTLSLMTVPLCAPQTLPLSGPQGISVSESAYGTIQDGLCASVNPVALCQLPTFAKVPIFTLVRTDGESGVHLVSLQLQQVETDMQTVNEHAQVPQLPSRISYLTPEDASTDFLSAERIFRGMGSNSWMCGGNEGISSSKHHVVSSGSGSN